MMFPSIDKVVVVCRTAAERAALVGTVAATGLIFYVPALSLQHYDVDLGDWVNYGPPNGFNRTTSKSANFATTDADVASVIRVNATAGAVEATLHTPGWAGYRVGIRRTNAGGSNVTISYADIDGASSIVLTAAEFRELLWDGERYTVVGSA